LGASFGLYRLITGEPGQDRKQLTRVAKATYKFVREGPKTDWLCQCILILSASLGNIVDTAEADGFGKRLGELFEFFKDDPTESQGTLMCARLMVKGAGARSLAEWPNAAEAVLKCCQGDVWEDETVLQGFQLLVALKSPLAADLLEKCTPLMQKEPEGKKIIAEVKHQAEQRAAAKKKEEAIARARAARLSAGAEPVDLAWIEQFDAEQAQKKPEKKHKKSAPPPPTPGTEIPSVSVAEVSAKRVSVSRANLVADELKLHYFG
jgi:hypothetical protein